MSYSNWINRVINLPRNSDFCLEDVTETVTIEQAEIKFIIKEAPGPDKLHGRLSRPRPFVAFKAPGLSSNYELDDKHRNILRREYEQYPDVMEQAYESLAIKFRHISEVSRELIQTQIQNELAEVVTRKLTGLTKIDDYLPEYLQFKTLLKKQLQARFNQFIETPVNDIILASGKPSLISLTIAEDQLEWNILNRYSTSISIQWRSVSMRPTLENFYEAAVRDMYFASINMPMFGQIITSRLRKIIDALQETA